MSPRTRRNLTTSCRQGVTAVGNALVPRYVINGGQIWTRNKILHVQQFCCVRPKSLAGRCESVLAGVSPPVWRLIDHPARAARRRRQGLALMQEQLHLMFIVPLL